MCWVEAAAVPISRADSRPPSHFVSAATRQFDRRLDLFPGENNRHQQDGRFIGFDGVNGIANQV